MAKGRFQVESDWRKSSDVWLTAVEQAEEAIVITDRPGNIQYVNPAYEKITGYTTRGSYRYEPELF